MEKIDDMLRKYIKQHIDRHNFPVNIPTLKSTFSIKKKLNIATSDTDFHMLMGELYPEGYAIDVFGLDTIWFKDGVFHRDGDKPAIITWNGTKYYYKNGKLHRDGLKPAVDEPRGIKIWFKNGQRKFSTNIIAVLFGKKFQ